MTSTIQRMILKVPFYRQECKFFLYYSFSLIKVQYCNDHKNVINSGDNDKQKRNFSGDSYKEVEEPAVTVIIILLVLLMTPRSPCPSLMLLMLLPNTLSG